MCRPILKRYEQRQWWFSVHVANVNFVLWPETLNDMTDECRILVIRYASRRSINYKKMIDKIVSLAKKTKNQSQKIAAMRGLRNQIHAAAVKKITGEFLDKFSSRNSGYTRVIRLEKRKSDSAQMAIIEFV